MNTHPAWSDYATTPHREIFQRPDLARMAQVDGTWAERAVYEVALNSLRLAAWRLRVDARDPAWAHVCPTPLDMSHLRLVRRHAAVFGGGMFRVIGGRVER